jgi:hypothetical protein
MRIYHVYSTHSHPEFPSETNTVEHYIGENYSDAKDAFKLYNDHRKALNNLDLLAHVIWIDVWVRGSRFPFYNSFHAGKFPKEGEAL